MKHCRRCSTDKPETDFARNAARKDGLSDWCRECNRAYDQAHRELQPKTPRKRLRRVAPDASWRRAQFARYGVTSCDVARMRIEQGDLCAICRNPEVNGRSLAIDHCHDTGRVRGLLCRNCNTAIGKLGDTPESLRRALAYLEAS